MAETQPWGVVSETGSEGNGGEIPHPGGRMTFKSWVVGDTLFAICVVQSRPPMRGVANI